MPYRKRSNSKKFFLSFAKGLGIIALVLLAVVSISMFLKSTITKEKAKSTEAPIKLAMAEIQEPVDADSEISGKYYGLCEKNSIHSVEDFRRTVQSDPVLSAHFAEFNWKTAKLGKQDENIWTFVSFRKGDVIKRTSKPVMLPKGDGYISDGVRSVRTYCCNDYVMAPPPMQVSLAAPADPVELVDGPPRRMENKSEVVAGPPRQLSSGSPAEYSTGSVPEYLEKIPVISPTVPTTVDKPIYYNYSGEKHITTVPEPGTFYLMGAGMAAFVLFSLLRWKRAKPD